MSRPPKRPSPERKTAGSESPKQPFRRRAVDAERLVEDLERYLSAELKESRTSFERALSVERQLEQALMETANWKGRYKHVEKLFLNAVGRVASLQSEAASSAEADSTAPASVATTSSTLRETLARNIRVARAEQRLTQRELGRLAGVGADHISAIERGAAAATVDMIERLADALGTTGPQLLIRR